MSHLPAVWTIEPPLEDHVDVLSLPRLVLTRSQHLRASDSAVWTIELPLEMRHWPSFFKDGPVAYSDSASDSRLLGELVP